MSFAAFATSSIVASGAASLRDMQVAEAAETGTGRLERILRSGTLRAGQYLSYKPYGFKHPDGEPDGFDVDLTKMLASDMGVKVEFIDNTWDGIIPALQADKFDVITAHLSMTTKRAMVIQFASPHSFSGTGFIFRSEDAAKFSSLANFNDPKRTVSILIQDAAHITMQRYFPKTKIQDFNSAAEAILAVQTKKVDFSAAEVGFLSQYAKEHEGLKIKAIDIPGSTNPAAIAFTAGSDNDQLRFFLDTWVRFYYWTGKYEALWKKWVPAAARPKVDKFMAPV
jgi:ABC-type amino acid transport substrate-binding protein